jgi:hypothetical protein
MSTYRLAYPADLKRQLMNQLPGDGHRATPYNIVVTPRDKRGRKSPVYDADFYEVKAFYINKALDRLDILEAAFKHIPGVYRTTQVHSADGEAQIQDPEWPVGSTRRDKTLRVMVIALMRNPEEV